MDEGIRDLERKVKAGDASAKPQLDRARARAGLHEPLSEVLSELDQLEAELQKAEAEFRDEGMKDLERYLDSFFASEPEVPVVTLRGYTPEFIDGDLCEHSQSVIFGEPAEDEEEERVPARLRGCERALGEFKPVLHAKYGTNWQLTVRRKEGGGIELTREPWECGY